ncbi:MAG TPA: Asd/ArgC dimerization domain-containing protein [Pyrinomonadaceae bacterium]|jgi:aspartate-semialdehyde dehydrogenase
MFRRGEKIPVAVLGATGMVGRRFSELLIDHPAFELKTLVGYRSVGDSYGQVWERKEAAMREHYGADFWQPRPCPERLRDFHVGAFRELLHPSSPGIVFSAIPPEFCELEEQLLAAGKTIFSNSPCGRFEEANPLVVTEVNGREIKDQRFIKNPNCVTSGLVLILDPLAKHYGLKEVSVVTFQSLSGRGDAKYRRDLVVGNIYPLHNSDERTEEYIKREVKKILGEHIPTSISCQRVYVQEGHFVNVKLKTERKIKSAAEAAEVLRSYNPLKGLALPSSPDSPLVTLTEAGRPRPAQDAFHGRGMAVAVGGVSTDDDVYDLRLQYVVNNLIRGAAGGALLNAELYLHNNSQARA